ncbi:MAG: putative quinol monooxygenase [Fimbriiglobus sp.]
MLRGILAAAVLFALAPVAAADEHPIIKAVKGDLKDPSKPFLVLVKFKVKPGGQPKLEAAFAECAKSTRKEPGCLTYELNRNAVTETQFVAYEKWKNLDGLAEHLAAAHTIKLLAAFPDVLDGGPEVQVFVPTAE